MLLAASPDPSVDARIRGLRIVGSYGCMGVRRNAVCVCVRDALDKICRRQQDDVESFKTCISILEVTYMIEDQYRR